MRPLLRPVCGPYFGYERNADADVADGRGASSRSVAHSIYVYRAGAFTVWAYAAWSAPRGWLGKWISFIYHYVARRTCRQCGRFGYNNRCV